jgi:hypothetical protein
MTKEFTCICGYSCFGSQKYNAHRAHCELYLRSVGKYEKVREANKRAADTGRAAHLQKLADKRKRELDQWLTEAHVCEKCGAVMTSKFGSGRFCSRACANSRELTAKTRDKIKSSMAAKPIKEKQPSSAYLNYIQNPKFCIICGNAIPYDKRLRKTCCEECLHASFAAAGKASAVKVCKRSKNEIAFCQLCESYFGKESVLHNVQMFNGWDADIILPKLKLAILWNGPWHYKKIHSDHSLRQVQNRDAIKLSEIAKCGFKSYIIKDLGSESDNKVTTEFNLFLDYIKTFES